MSASACSTMLISAIHSACTIQPLHRSSLSLSPPSFCISGGEDGAGPLQTNLCKQFPGFHEKALLLVIIVIVHVSLPPPRYVRQRVQLYATDP